MIMAHSGCYGVIAKLRKEFWLEHCFSTVKKVLKECVNCRRFNNRSIKLNQNFYRCFRVSPCNVPYGFIFIDYLGPFNVIMYFKNIKIWLLCFTCLWSRAVNLVLCPDMTVKNFLRAFQMHVYSHGLPKRVFSDLGSQIVAGGNMIGDFMKDVDTQSYLAENIVKFEGFEQYLGNSSLGSLCRGLRKTYKTSNLWINT